MATSKSKKLNIKKVADKATKKLRASTTCSQDKEALKVAGRKAAEVVQNIERKKTKIYRIVFKEMVETKKQREILDTVDTFKLWSGVRASGCNGAECGFGCGVGCGAGCLIAGGATVAFGAAGGTAGGSGTSIALNSFAAPSTGGID